jgi:hypothetical protein
MAWLRSTIALVNCSGVSTAAGGAAAAEDDGCEGETSADVIAGAGGGGGRVLLDGGGGGRVEVGEEPDISDTKLIGFRILPGLLRRL